MRETTGRGESSRAIRLEPVECERRARAGAGLVLLAALLGAATSRAQTVNNPNLTVTAVLPLFTLAEPTSMEFVGPDDFLVLEKDTGIVRRVQNGVLSPTIALDAAVNARAERGMLGIAVNTEIAAEGLPLLYGGPGRRRRHAARQPRLPLHLEPGQRPARARS